GQQHRGHKRRNLVHRQRQGGARRSRRRGQLRCQWRGNPGCPAGGGVAAHPRAAARASGYGHATGSGHSRSLSQISRHRSRQAVAVLTCLLLLLSRPAGADLRVEPDTRQLSDDQLALTPQLLSEVDEGLPPRMRQQLDRTVQVRWSYGLPEQVMGRASRTDRILLNGRFLDQLLESGSATLPGRTHPNLYTELQAALIHELAHLYDQGRYWHPAETLQLRYCRTRFETQSSPGL